MTPAQRKFKKQMKELEREGKIPENYAPRRERGSYRKPISIVAVLCMTGMPSVCGESPQGA